MYFFSKKKQKRDRDAGLVFHWRGAKKHHLGKLIALMVAASCFGFVAYAVRIEGPKQPLVSKRTGTIIMLNEDDPLCRRLMLQIEEKSPFPSRWDPAHDAPTRERVSVMAESVMGKAWEYRPELRKLPPRSEKSTRLASILEPNAGLVTGMMQTWRQDLNTSDTPVAADLFVRGAVLAKSSLSERLIQSEWKLPANLVAEDWFGQSFRFMLGVDEHGIVRSCVPLPGGSTGAIRATDRQKKFAVWIRSQRFKSTEQLGIVFGELQLQIEATHER